MGAISRTALAIEKALSSVAETIAVRAKAAFGVVPSPLPGPQQDFVSCGADIVIYGGAAGGGKSFALLMDPLKYTNRPGFQAVIFRRTYPQITAGGGLWDTAMEMYPAIGGRPNRANTMFTFPNGGRIVFRHLQYEQTIYSHQGAQYAYIGFDEGTHFTQKQFLYLLSRNRSAAGIPCRVRVTCNPDSESWLAPFLAWWIDKETGYPIPERSGVVRWLYRDSDVDNWYASKDEAMAAHPNLATIAPPRSATFIPANLDDNTVLMESNPEYKANLLAQSQVERERLLKGNWKVTASDGLFKSDWFKVEDSVSPNVQWDGKAVRAWDLAATEQKDANDPDYTVGVKMRKDKQGRFWVLDVRRERLSPLGVETLVKRTAEQDGHDVEILIELEGGASGKMVIANFIRLLAGYTARSIEPKGDKVARANGMATQAEHGNIVLIRADWNAAYLSEHSRFPFGAHDDQVDAAAHAFGKLVKGNDRRWELR